MPTAKRFLGLFVWRYTVLQEPLRKSTASKHNLIFLEFFETFKFAAILAHHLFKPYSYQSLNMVKGGLVKHGLKFFSL